MLKEDYWPLVRSSFGLDGEVATFITSLEYGIRDTVYSYHLWILDSVSSLLYLEMQQPKPSFSSRPYLLGINGPGLNGMI